MTLKGDKYETADEVRFRLENTIVLYDGKPVLISRVGLPEDEGERGEIARVYFYELPYNGRGQEVRKYLSSRRFDVAPFPMGYMNISGQAIYVSRSPLRQNQQGLNSNTCALNDVTGARSATFTFADVYKAQGFVDMVRGVYPSMEEALVLLNTGEAISVALGRSFALTFSRELETFNLVHKSTTCAVGTKGDTKIKLPEYYKFLRQEAEQARIPLA